MALGCVLMGWWLRGLRGPAGEVSQVLRDTVTLCMILQALAGMGWAEPWVAA